MSFFLVVMDRAAISTQKKNKTMTEQEKTKMIKNLIQVGFGAGTNSTAMLIGMHERGIKPDFILFSDTGGERPHTYEHVEEVNEWQESIGWP